MTQPVDCRACSAGHAQLLATKLFVPRARENVVSRPRLIGWLGPAVEGGLTPVSAPAGYGKTTLVAE